MWTATPTASPSQRIAVPKAALVNAPETGYLQIVHVRSACLWPERPICDTERMFQIGSQYLLLTAERGRHSIP